MILSIIVPAYNVERFITRCLRSLSEHANGSDVEIIVVDDASTDQSLQIVETLADSIDIRIVRHQENLGLGAARNTGLEAASGRYVWFFDGDDFASSSAVARIVQVLSEKSNDILVIDFSCADESGQSVDWIFCPFRPCHGATLSGPQFFTKYFATTYAWIYIVRRELLVQHNLRFQPRINMQDAELLPQIMVHAQSILVSGIDAYVYVKRAGSYINSTHSGTRERYFQSVLEVYRRLKNFQTDIVDEQMLQGLAAKISSMRRILLMAYVYDRLDAASLRNRLALLKDEGVYPFKRLPNETIKEFLIRSSVNLFPSIFPLPYRWVRETVRGLRAGSAAKVPRLP
ncbi:glycosyltransferase family 2 protein [Luteimonas sp. MJ204]|uniref:glycosyltransferase family 2 protein n=1 Tax=Luteimonas sp. MJ145 TaxID=3129234 RepID=UPI0031BB2E47